MSRMYRRAGGTSVSSLYGQALMRLAQAVGLHQARLAAYLGVTRVQVHHWTHGKEPIAPGQLLLITKRLQEALAHTLAQPGGQGKAELATILNDVFHENLQALGFPTYQTFQCLLGQLTAASEAFAQAPHPTPAQHTELGTHAGAVNLVTGIINDLAELFGTLDCPALTFLSGAMEDSHANTDPQQTQGPGHDENDSRAHPGTRGAYTQTLDV